MAPSHSRQLLVWSLPTIAVLLSYLWYRKKRIGLQSDTGGGGQKNIKQTTGSSSNNKTIQQQQQNDTTNIETNNKLVDKTIIEDTNVIDITTPQSSPNRSFSRSLSGVDSQPIDIIIPPELRSIKTSPVIISDEDLDLEIEKIKSMKTSTNNTVMSRSKQEDNKMLKSSPIQETSTNNNNSTTTPMKQKKFMKNKKEMKNKMTKDLNGVEEKLSTLKLNKETTSTATTTTTTPKRQSDDLQRQSSERDSANHSPADVMLASPSLSSISDNHSEGSSDSGKGGSDVATPPPSRTPAIDGDDAANLPTIYEFVIPQHYVGKLIGRHGTFVAQIRDKTNAHIVVKKHPNNSKLKVCLIDGTRQEIDKALKIIRDKFPLKRYPDITLEQVHLLSQVPIPLTPDHLYVSIIV